MRAFVFTDASLKEHAGQFVWLEIDTEKSKNAAIRKRLGINALPTFFILDPADERVALRWVGGATLPQLTTLLADGRRAVATPASAQGATNADAALATADRLYGDGHYAEAADAYELAIAHAPANWPSYGRSMESLLYSLSSVDSSERVALIARDAYPRVAGTPSAPSVAASGLGETLELPADYPQRRELIAIHEARLKESLADPDVRIADDDRSSYMASLMDARKDAGDSTGARKAAEAWSTFLDGAATRAKTPDQRVVFDSHRLSAYLELGQPERAVPMLQQSQRDFPDDYNPPARLAVAYNAMKQWDDAIASTDRALKLAYGPRKLRIYSARVDAFTGKGDAAAARKTLEESIAYAEALPPGQRSESTIAALKKKLDAQATP
jgi:tetratricopeptide (TPR) repeat protein